jgi:phospholipid N-methyltransferase
VAPPSVLRDHVRILAEFVRQPIRTGSVVPSSRHLAERLLEGSGVHEATTIVELGPGTGPFTRLIVERARAEASILAVELNPRLAEDLMARFPRVEVVNDSATRLPELLRARGREHAGVVLSGLPFVWFAEELQRSLVDAILEALPPGGFFATFAYVPAAYTPPGRRFRRLLSSRFARVTTSPIVWRNFPPAFVYRCTR